MHNYVFYYNTCTHICFTALLTLSVITRVSWYQKGKPIWILLKQETMSGSGISWAICISAPRPRQITMPAPHHSVFYRPDALSATQPTASKHWRYVLLQTRNSFYGTRYLSHCSTRFAFNPLFVNWVTSLTPRSRDVIGHVTIGPQLVVSYWSSVDSMSLSCTVAEILSVKNNWVTSLTLGVTWRHWSRDHWNHTWSFPIGGLLIPSHYLAWLMRYYASFG